MSNRAFGLALMGAGALLVLIGLVAWATSGGGETLSIRTTSAPQTTTSTAETTTTLVTTTTTSTPTTTSTTVLVTTTTTIDAGAEIPRFVEAFAEAIAQEDTEFLFDTLHPAVTELFQSQECRTFIAEEILRLEQYGIAGQVTGPTRTEVAGSIVEMFSVPVTFTFQGQEFASAAAFAFEGAEVRWFTQCGE